MLKYLWQILLLVSLVIVVFDVFDNPEPIGDDLDKGIYILGLILSYIPYFLA